MKALKLNARAWTIALGAMLGGLLLGGAAYAGCTNACPPPPPTCRSEEHTSELQSH